MGLKKEIKRSEAKIIVYLSQVANHNKTVTLISRKLDIEYGYLGRILNGMMTKKWIYKHKVRKNAFYDLEDKTKHSLIHKAREVLKNDKSTRRKEVEREEVLRNYTELKE